MITMVEKNQILIKYFTHGESKSSIARSLKISRNTVRKYIDEENRLREKAEEDLSIGLKTNPTYDISNRKKRILTAEIMHEIDNLLKKNAEKRKSRMQKQQMKKIDIHLYLESKGYKIGYTTVCNYIRLSENKRKEAFIKQVFSPGCTCEFDWGEVKLIINGELKKFNMAVFTSAYSNHRFAKLFNRQDSLAFSQSHIDYFRYLGFVFKEMVYDNMRVAVAKFVGTAEERATDSLLELSNYYKFGFRFCNIRKGNEKGHVERSVEYIRRKSYGIRDEFSSIEEANKHLLDVCERLNDTSQKLRENQTANTLFEEEKRILRPSKIPYQCFKEEFVKVDKYCTVSIYRNRYSVPDYLVSKLLNVRVFAEKIDLYYKDEFVCTHKRSYSVHHWTIDLKHYLFTFKTKPGALKNSLALAQLRSEMKLIFSTYFSENVKEFIELLQKCVDKDIEMLAIEKAVKYLKNKAPKSINRDSILAIIDKQKEEKEVILKIGKKPKDEIEEYAKASLKRMAKLIQ